MIRLKDIFYFQNGLSSERIELHEEKKGMDYIPYLRPSKNAADVIAGYVKKSAVEPSHIFSKHSLYVGTDGQGSHSYAYLSSSVFVPNSNVIVLTPKVAMSTLQKLFYAKAIGMNRWKFSYGRKPKGYRLQTIQVPSVEEIPTWVHKIKLPQAPTESPHRPAQVALHDREWAFFTLKNLFTIGRGSQLIRDFENGNTPLISSKSATNGVGKFVAKTNEKVFGQNLITVSNDGSVGEAFYQEKTFYAAPSVNVLNPKFHLNPYTALFLITVISFEKYRFNYGRKWGKEKMEKSKIKLPVTTEGTPDWAFMESYIKSLPYSKNLEKQRSAPTAENE